MPLWTGRNVKAYPTDVENLQRRNGGKTLTKAGDIT